MSLFVVELRLSGLFQIHPDDTDPKCSTFRLLKWGDSGNKFFDYGWHFSNFFFYILKIWLNWKFHCSLAVSQIGDVTKLDQKITATTMRLLKAASTCHLLGHGFLGQSPCHMARLSSQTWLSRGLRVSAVFDKKRAVIFDMGGVLIAKPGPIFKGMANSVVSWQADCFPFWIVTEKVTGI